MRVCYLVNEATVTAGWGRYAVEVIKGTRALGIEPVVVTASTALDPALAEVEHHPILLPVLSTRFNTPRTLFQAPALWRILNTCEVLHCTVELYAPLAALACFGKVPFILNAHGTWAIRPLENQTSRLLFAPAFRRAKRVLCLSDFTYQWMSRLIDLPQAEILTGGVTLADYERPVPQVKLPDWVGHEKVAFTVGAFKTRKGQHVTLEAIALARQHIPNLHYVLAGNPEGNPEYVSQLKQRIAELGLEGYVHFLGVISQDELVAWYQQSDVFILTQVNDGSSFEGLGMVFLEAGAASTPSIGARDCGAEAAILDGESGFLVPQNDPQATAQALVRLFSDEALRQQMGQAAHRQAEKLSWYNLCHRVVEIYNEVLR